MRKTWLCGRCKLGTVEVNYHEVVNHPWAPDGCCAVCEAREHWKPMPESADLHHMGARMRDALVKLRVALSDAAPERAPLTEVLAAFARETYAEAQDVINDWDKLNGGPPLATSRMAPPGVPGADKLRTLVNEQREDLSPEQRAVFDKDYSDSPRTIRQRVNDKMRKNDSVAHIDDEGKVAALRVIALIDVLDEERKR